MYCSCRKCSLVIIIAKVVLLQSNQHQSSLPTAWLHVSLHTSIFFNQNKYHTKLISYWYRVKYLTSAVKVTVKAVGANAMLFSWNIAVEFTICMFIFLLDYTGWWHQLCCALISSILKIIVIICCPIFFHRYDKRLNVLQEHCPSLSDNNLW